MRGRDQSGRVVTHRCENFKEDHKKMASKYHHEIHRGILKDFVENALQTMSTDETAMSGRIYDNEEGRTIFSEEGLAAAMQRLKRGKEHTVQQRKRHKDDFTGSPPRELAKLVLIEREVRKHDSFEIGVYF